MTGTSPRIRLPRLVFLMAGMLAGALGWQLVTAPSLAQPRAQAEACAPLRVMSFNVRLPLASDGANAWPARRDLLVHTIATAQPDLIGTQELFQEQGDALMAGLPGFGWFGLDRRGGHGDEHMGLFYARDRLILRDWGQFWLSDTPQQVASITWGNVLPRNVTWGLFEDAACGQRFYALNTHFPYREEDAQARLKAAGLIAEWIAARDQRLPVVLLGDFNTSPDGPVHARLRERLDDVRQTAPQVHGPEGTFHGFTGEARERIDWILVRGMRAQRTQTLTTSLQGRYPSDHFPVMADLAFAPVPD